MSEGSKGAAQTMHGGAARRSENFYAGIILIAISLLGPILGIFFGKGVVFAYADGMLLALGDGFRQGAYSLPLAIFGILMLTVRIKSPQDYMGGVVLVAVALFALWAGSDLPGMRGFAFGPGTAPRLFAYGLLGLGVGVALTGLLADGPPEEPFSISGPLGGALLIVILIPMTIYAKGLGKLIPGIAPDVVLAALETLVLIGLAILITRFAPRGPVLITTATLIFAVSVRPLGLVIASYISIVVAAHATKEVRLIETLIWAAVLTLFCSLLFPWGLNLPLQLWPRF